MQALKVKTPFFRLAVIVCIIILLMAGMAAAWQYYKYKFIRGEVKKAINKSSNGLYAIHYDNIEIDEAAGYLHVTNLRIQPDTAMYKKMVTDSTNPPLLLQLTIPELKVTGVKTPRALLESKIEGRRVDIRNAVVEFYYAKKSKDTTDTAPALAMYEQILGNLRLIQADTVSVENTSLAFIDIHNNKRMMEASGISLNMQDILIDSLHSNDTSRFFFAKKITVTAEKGNIKNKQGNYIYHFNGIDFNTVSRGFRIKNIQIEPQLGEAEFAKASKLQKDRFDLSFSGITLNNISLLQLMNESVMADELIVKQSNCKIYRDISYPHDKKNRVGSYPHQQLMDLPIGLSIKKIVFGTAFIEYKEKNPKSGYSGKVQFNKASAVITHITNITSEIEDHNNCVLVFKSNFLDIAPLQAKIIMQLQSPQGRFSIGGTVGGFDATQLNILLKPMALATVEKGKVNRLNFNFNCSNYASDGTLVLLYEDLKMNLLRKDSVEKKIEKKGLASFVANLVIKNANPLRKQDIRKVEVHLQRDINRSFFNLIWKSIFAGVKESVGMNNSNAKK
jgi:hypothetical protein